MIGDFHFIRPLFLVLIPLGLFLTYLLWNRVSANTKWFDVCDPHLINHLLVGKQLRSNGIPFIGMALGWIIGSIAMAGPAWERLPQPAHNAFEGRTIVFDLSLSMNSSDVQPTRLVRARYKLADLILDGSDLQQGLVVFAGDAFVVAPLTDDTDTLINLTPSLDTNTVPVQGSRADLAIELAASLISNTGLDEGEIILITDGVSPETEDVASRVLSKGYRISVMAVGTSGGAPVKLGNGELLKDSGGNIVVPGVDHDALRRVAIAGGGRYVEMSVNNSDIEALSRPGIEALDMGLNHSLFEETGNEKFKSDQWQDNGPWLVLPLLLIMALGFRKGWVLTLVLLAMPLTPGPVHAFGWDDLWLRKDQQAARHFKEEKYDQIRNDAPIEWRGAAKYRNGDFVGAVGDYSINDAATNRAAQKDAAQKDEDRADTHYNRANAMVRSGSLRESLAVYDRALEVNPDMEDARFNKRLIEDLLDQQNDQSPQQSQNDDNAENSRGEKEQGNSSRPSGQQSDQQDLQNSDQGTRKNNTDNKSSQNNTPDSTENSEAGDNSAEQYEPLRQNSNTQNIGKEVEEGGEIVDEFRIPMSEQQQALEQWLQRVPDDPGGLLRRKFAHQYSLRTRQTHPERW